MLRPLSRRDRAVALVVFAATLAILVVAGERQGNVRDEGYYFDAAELYWGWYGELGDHLRAGTPRKSFTRANIDRWFGYNHEHPALMKTLSGISWRLLHRCHCPEQAGRHPVGYPKPHLTLGLLDEEAAFRLPAQVAVAAMAALLVLFGAAAWSRTAGVIAAVLAAGAPRLFFDAQLDAFDAPIAALWVAVVYAWWRGLGATVDGTSDERRWRWRLGVLFGLALATKHNAFFLPVVLAAHWLYLAWRDRRWPSWRPFAWMALCGPLVYLACWPWLWFNTVRRFGEYVAFHVHHVYYNMEYFGVNYNKPPFPLSFPYAMTALTVPATTLALALGGAFVLARQGWRSGRRGPKPAPNTTPSATATAAAAAAQRDPRASGLLVGLNALFPMLILTVTRAPIFGATKHWHASVPFVALLAGYGVESLLRRLVPVDPAVADEKKWRRRRVLAVTVGAIVCAPTLAECWRAHPYALSHYNLVAGGPAGGADLGMNRQFWGYATRGLLPWINDHAAPGAPVYWHDTNGSQLNMHVREGRLRADLRDTGLEEPGVRASDLALVIHEKHFNKYEYWIWDFYGTTQPSIVLDDEGVPLVTLYQRPKTDSNLPAAHSPGMNPPKAR